VIVGANLSESPIDAPQLPATLDAIEEQCGALPEKASADDGFFSGDNIADRERRGIDGYLAPGREGKDIERPYDKRKRMRDPKRGSMALVGAQ